MQTRKKFPFDLSRVDSGRAFLQLCGICYSVTTKLMPTLYTTRKVYLLIYAHKYYGYTSLLVRYTGVSLANDRVSLYQNGFRWSDTPDSGR